MKSKFKEIIKAKGYTLEDLAERWGFKIRWMYEIQKAPKPVHLDAVNGLPSKESERRS